MDGSLKLKDYCVSELTGFMSPHPPSQRLPSYYDAWENLITELPVLNREKGIRFKIHTLPQLTVSEQHLISEEDWWRAYTVLTFLAQSYIWVSGEKGLPSAVPACIAVPWWEAADHLSIPPVVTYASTALQNWYLIDPSKGIIEDNMGIMTTFTGTKDEEWFYLVPLFVELAAAPGLVAMLEIYKSMENDNYIAIEASFRNMQSSIEKMIAAVNRMYEHCKPDVFYQQIRPYQAGSMGLDAFPDGLMYEGVDTIPKKYSGASAAQSSTLPAFDTFLGVEHDGVSKEFLMLQRAHMPEPHRKFLQTMPSVKDYVKNCRNASVISAYNETIKTLTKFRNQHIILVTRYIVEPKNRLDKRLNQSLETKGTGGSNFMVFLKSSRNETSECEIN